MVRGAFVRSLGRLRRAMAPALACVGVSLATARSAGAQDELTLTRALDLGRQRAPAIAAARARAASAAENVDEVAAAYFPTLNANLTASGAAIHDLQPTSPPVAAGHPLLYVYNNKNVAGSAGGSVRWTLFDFGRTSAAVAAARGALAGARAGVAGTEASVLRDVAEAFVTVYYREQFLDTAHATLSERERLVVLARGMVASGLQPPLEAIRAAARAETARLDVATAEADVNDARATLASLLGIESADSLRVARPRLPSLDADVPRARLAADRLPGVLASEADYETKSALVDAAKARYFPVVSLAVDGFYRYTQSSGSVGGRPVDPPFPLNTGSVTGSLALTVPLFDASIAPNLSGARLDAVNASATAEQVRRDARTEATRAMLSVRATAAAVEHARTAARDAAGVLAIVQARYVQGLSAPLELIEAESSDASARATFGQAELTHALAVVRACAATGRALVEEGP